jgi:hypothetical protein
MALWESHEPQRTGSRFTYTFKICAAYEPDLSTLILLAVGRRFDDNWW